MVLLSGAKLAKELGTTGAQISRLKDAGYLTYHEETKKFDLEASRRAWQDYLAIKNGELLNLTQVAEYLGTSKSTITQKTQRGELQVVEVGSKEVFYRFEDVRALKEKREASPKRSQEEENPEKEEIELEILKVKLESERIKLAEHKKEILPVRVVEQMVSSLMQKFEEMVSTMPTRLVHQIQHCKTDEERRLRITEEMAKYVDGLSRFVAENNEAN